MVPMVRVPDTAPSAAVTSSTSACCAANRRCAGHESLAGGGQPYPTRSAFKQRTAQLFFQFGDLVAQRRLHRMAALRRPGKVQLFRHRQRIADLFQVHGIYLEMR